MVILTNCLAEKTDEGCLKAANCLVKKIKEKCPSTTVVSFERTPDKSDIHLKLNKLFLNYKLYRLLRSKNEPVLYIPFSSNTKASIVRTWVLSRYCKSQVNVLFVLRHPMHLIFQGILKWSGARIISLSGESHGVFQKIAAKEAVYLKAGVDTKKFKPISREEKSRLRKVYGIPEDAKVVLHVGHLKEGRNIRALLNIDETFHVLLVVSTQTEGEWDQSLRNALGEKPNITLVDTFVEKIEQIYQLSDVYLFPVQAAGNCIDTPLSVLEAAACGLPVVATAYGELKEIIHREGFYQVSSFEDAHLNKMLAKACTEQKSARQCALEYDWDEAAERLLLLDSSPKKGD